MEHISITKDNLTMPRDWFWAKVGVVAFIVSSILFCCTWYAYRQGFVKGFKRGYMDAYAVDSCLTVDKEVRNVVGTRAAD